MVLTPCRVVQERAASGATVHRRKKSSTDAAKGLDSNLGHRQAQAATRRSRSPTTQSAARWNEPGQDPWHSPPLSRAWLGSPETQNVRLGHVRVRFMDVWAYELQSNGGRRGTAALTPVNITAASANREREIVRSIEDAFPLRRTNESVSVT